MVVEPADDLDLAAIREPPVGDVGLPQLVGRRGLEAEPRAARALARLGHDQPGGVEDPPDRRARGRPSALPPEVPGDRHGAGIEPAGGELRAQGDDPLAERLRRPARTGERPAGPWLHAVQAALAVAAQEPLQVLATDPGATA